MEVANVVFRDGTLSAEVRSGENAYVAIITDDADFYCSCLDAFMTKNGNCKHLKFLIEYLKGVEYLQKGQEDILNSGKA